MADFPVIESDEVVIADGTTGVNRLTINSDGSINATPVDGLKASYSASVVGLVVAAAATDIFTIVGSGTKTIRVTRIELSGTTTSGSGLGVNISLIKRSTADSAGTSTTQAAVPHDSSSAAATTTISAYTANPTLGTTVGTMRSNRYGFVTTGAATNSLIWLFGDRPSQATVLRGAAQSLVINLNGATITGPVLGISIEWTEE